MLFLALLLSFFVGAIPFGVLIGKARGVDVRASGSGNIGATNVWRVLGPKAGTAAFVLDVLKGVAGPLFGRWLIPNSEIGIAACGIFAVLGHTFSPFLGFKGGKGISTSLGALFGLMPLVGILAFAFWGVILGLSRMVSLASMAACVSLPILALALHTSTPSFIVATLMGVLAFVKHIPNLKRILAGTEPKVGQKKAAVEGQIR
ncbi:glycerol-3-phosphate acyltransferase PlsY [Abditibacterium utsteinense]|uniref:Glycerol-3-phosphate acyltransferase n=1 Tax=Abditibacterium utsteinense TaxID=1960156 RepID=A0A2S8SQC0_9BACT|nr:glycerol-3-phosphate 1-O-acyltransferase PlsY [Abditibacterium utsteinense]PQV62985.1 glycerol-3-phosphate acyltransferase PlsY [Abditibacterium utsteinense]